MMLMNTPRCMSHPEDVDSSNQVARLGSGRIRLGIPAAIFLLLLSAWPVAAQADPYEPKRTHMVELQVRGRGITEPGVLSAMKDVPRHRFLPDALQSLAYEGTPVAIAPGQTLPAATLSAQMIEHLGLDGDEKVLEIGTGTGYDAAILSRLAREVYTIEIDADVGQRARGILESLGYANVHVKIGNGLRGWPEKAPFDAILVTAAPHEVPEHLLEQLAEGGRMVLAVGDDLMQDLQVILKTPEGIERQFIKPVRIGPMTGEEE